MAPLILSQPEPVIAATGQTAAFSVKAATVPKSTYQWFKNGKAIPGATEATLKIENASANDAAAYTVTVTNSAGNVTSQPAALTVQEVGPTLWCNITSRMQHGCMTNGLKFQS